MKFEVPGSRARGPSLRPRIAMVSTHGYVAALPPLGAADTGGQVVYVLVLSKKLAQLGYDVAVGRIARNKGYDLLLPAFAEVAAREPSARLVLAIGGERVESTESQILATCHALVDDLGLRDRVRFMGFVPDAQMADLYRAADVFVLSSRYEPFGMTAIEAMACGTPTVVTTHGGLFRTLRFGDSGLFADPFDPMDLGITILKALRHAPIAERLSRNGAETARGLFTWTGVAQQLLAAAERAPVPARVGALAKAEASECGRERKASNP